LDFILGAEETARVRLLLTSVEKNPTYVLTLPGRAEAAPLDVSIHTIDGVMVMELESIGRGKCLTVLD
jgi:hypothetical protein